MNDTKYIAVWQSRWSPTAVNWVGTDLKEIVAEIRNDGGDPLEYTFYEIDGSLLIPKKLGYTLED